MRLFHTYTDFKRICVCCTACAYEIRLFFVKRIFRTCTTCAVLSGLYVQILLLRVSNLMCTYTTYALEATYAYQVRLLCVKQLISFSSGLEASVVVFLQRWSVLFKPQPSPDDDY